MQETADDRYPAWQRKNRRTPQWPLCRPYPGIEGRGRDHLTHRGPKVISADHTGVPDSMAGKGVARALLDYMLEDARKSGFRIIPVCPMCAASMPATRNGRRCSPRRPARTPRVAPVGLRVSLR